MNRVHHKRFHGIRYAFILTAAAVFLWGTGGSALAAESVELKLAHFMSPLHVQHQESFLPFAQNVEKLTQGRVRIKVYAGGALGGPMQLPDVVRTGIADMAFIVPSYTTGRFPRSSVYLKVVIPAKAGIRNWTGCRIRACPGLDPGSGMNILYI